MPHRNASPHPAGWNDLQLLCIKQKGKDELEVGLAPSFLAKLALQHLVELLLSLSGLLFVVLKNLLLAKPSDLFLFCVPRLQRIEVLVNAALRRPPEQLNRGRSRTDRSAKCRLWHQQVQGSAVRLHLV